MDPAVRPRLGRSGAKAALRLVPVVGTHAGAAVPTVVDRRGAGISKTAAGGEIDALDPGGFGAVTITKAITLDGGGGQVASILVNGSPGINVNAGANDVVALLQRRSSPSETLPAVAVT